MYSATKPSPQQSLYVTVNSPDPLKVVESDPWWPPLAYAFHPPPHVLASPTLPLKPEACQPAGAVESAAVDHATSGGPHAGAGSVAGWAGGGGKPHGHVGGLRFRPRAEPRCVWKKSQAIRASHNAILDASTLVLAKTGYLQGSYMNCTLLPLLHLQHSKTGRKIWHVSSSISKAWHSRSSGIDSHYAHART